VPHRVVEWRGGGLIVDQATDVHAVGQVADGVMQRGVDLVTGHTGQRADVDVEFDHVGNDVALHPAVHHVGREGGVAACVQHRGRALVGQRLQRGIHLGGVEQPAGELRLELVRLDGRPPHVVEPGLRAMCAQPANDLGGSDDGVVGAERHRAVPGTAAHT